MKLVDVEPIIAAWKTVGVDKKNEAKPFLDNDNYLVYIQGQIRNSIGDVFLDLADILEKSEPANIWFDAKKSFTRKRQRSSRKKRKVRH